MGMHLISSLRNGKHLNEGQPRGQNGWHQGRVNVGVNISCHRNTGELSLLGVDGVQKLEMYKGTYWQVIEILEWQVKKPGI